MPPPRLELRQVSKIYSSDGQNVEALSDVSLRVEAGTVTALVGRSGCGKSTLLNLAGAMDFPTSGEVLIDGRPTTALSERELTALRRKRIGFVFQFFQLLPTLTVLENVELPLLLAGRRRYNRPRRSTACAGWAWPKRPAPSRISSPAARCSASPSPAPWCIRPKSSSPTSPPAISTPPAATRS